jgi:hypothetical protein
MPGLNSFRQVDEKHVTFEVDQMLWSPKMDLIAVASVTGEVCPNVLFGLVYQICYVLESILESDMVMNILFIPTQLPIWIFMPIPFPLKLPSLISATHLITITWSHVSYCSCHCQRVLWLSYNSFTFDSIMIFMSTEEKLCSALNYSC